jgi:hypothetical protein
MLKNCELLHMSTCPQPRMATRVGIGVACLLIVIHLVAGFVCHTCFFDFEKPKTRSFHLHAGGDLNPCHHGRSEINPLTGWACMVTQDDTAYILPEIPRLPIMVSLFVPLVSSLTSHADRPLVTAHGRGPPHSII